MHYERTPDRRNFIFAFAISLILLCSIMVITVLAVQRTMPQAPHAPAEAEQYVYHPVASDTLTAVLLLTDGDELTGTLLVRFNPEYGQIPLTALPPEMLVRHGGAQTTIAELFANDHPRAVKAAITEETGIIVDRYACIPAETFLLLEKQVGSIRYELPQDFSYERGEYTIKLITGERRLDEQDLMHLIAYPDFETPQEKSRLIGDLFAQVINQNLDMFSEGKLQNIFKLFVNSVDTDITSVDYEPRRQAADFVSLLDATVAASVPAEGTVLEDGAFAPSEQYLSLLRQYFQTVA